MIYTIGFTQKPAEKFFSLLKQNDVDLLIDIRLNNTSQLAGFAKFPDIQFFLKNICSIDYIHDVAFAPSEQLLKDYKSKKITWENYEIAFGKIMTQRDIEKQILKRYSEFSNNNICLLCSEPTAEHCHRRLVAEYFGKVFGSKTVNL